MTDQTKSWEQQFRDVGARAEEELRQLVNYLNDEVVPEVRRGSSSALRSAASELQRLAEQLDDRKPSAGEAKR